MNLISWGDPGLGTTCRPWGSCTNNHIWNNQLAFTMAQPCHESIHHPKPGFISPFHQLLTEFAAGNKTPDVTGPDADDALSLSLGTRNVGYLKSDTDVNIPITRGKETLLRKNR